MSRRRRRSGLQLVEHVLLDALAQHVDPHEARGLLDRALASSPLPPAGSDAAPIADFIHDHVSLSLARVLGPEETQGVLDVADALVAPLRRDRLVCDVRPFRAPYVLLSDRPNRLEGVIDLSRVETLVEAACALDATPDATLVIDARARCVSLVSLALAAEDFPSRAQVLVVGASRRAEASFAALARRHATFVSQYLPLDLRAPAKPVRSAA